MRNWRRYPRVRPARALRPRPVRPARPRLERPRLLDSRALLWADLASFRRKVLGIVPRPRVRERIPAGYDASAWWPVSGPRYTTVEDWTGAATASSGSIYSNTASSW